MSLLHVLCLAVVLVSACSPAIYDVSDGVVPAGNLEAVYKQQPVSARYVASPPDSASAAAWSSSHTSDSRL